MRYMQQIPAAQQQELMTTTFRGYNHNEIIEDGELYDTKNLSADRYPTMSLRKKRGITSYDTEGQESVVPLLGVHGREKLTLIRGESVIYDVNTVGGIRVSTLETMQPKKIVGFGAYICIWPDKVYFNTTDLQDCGSIERLWDAEEDMPEQEYPVAQLCRADGTDYDMTQIATGATPPADPQDGDLWIDPTSGSDVLRQYSAAQEDWVEVPTVYIKISGKGIGNGLRMYDTVDISGLKAAQGDTAPDPAVVTQLGQLNGKNIVYAAGKDYLIIAGMLSSQTTIEKTLQANRRVPDFDFIVESNNRLWGCQYGKPKYQQIWSGLGWDTSMTLCTRSGAEYDLTDATVSGEEPASPAENDLWIKITADNDFELYRCVGTSPTQWKYVETTCVKFSATGIGKHIENGMEVRIQGLRLPQGEQDPNVTTALVKLQELHKVVKRDDDYFVIEGITPANVEHLGGSDVIEPINSQVWVEKNIEAESVFLNEIHASKLGDFRNWDSYMGLSADSYTASVGTDGPFTGAATQLGYPVFFKENCIHRIYGQTPDSFQIQTTMCRGVQEGSGRSVVVANEAIYYKSRTDVMIYDGNMPASIGAQLGSKAYSEARAGTVNGKYYISMKDAEDGNWYQFAYDTKTGTWYREDRLKALMYATVKDELYLIDEENNTLVTVNGTEGTAEDEVPWEAVFGISGIEYILSTYGKARSETRGYRYLSRFDIRMYMEPDAQLEMWIEYDTDGTWIKQGEIRGRNSIKSFVLPVIPRRCDHLRVKLRGTGDFRIFSISRILEVGGDG